MLKHDDAHNHNIQIYFDLIVGTILSSSALAGIAYWTIVLEIADFGAWLMGLIFWILYLALSVFLIGWGLYRRYLEKHYDEREPRKDLRAPIV